MKLKRLLQPFSQITVRGSRDTDISGICSDSRLVSPGNLFIARKGGQYDGAAFVPDAIAAGAAAILTDLYDPSLRHVTQLIANQVGALEAPLAAYFYGHPSRDLFMVGVTGTNGKTTTTFLIRHLLEQLGVPCGLMGSIEHIVGPLRYQATHTTPSVTVVHKVLADMVRAHCQSAVMEVTSHALDQGRVDEIEFDVGIFTNLTQDHLDYHGSMEAYKAAKAHLFSRVKHAIVNGDDPAYTTMLANCSAPPLTYGFSDHCDVQASDLQLSLQGSRFMVSYRAERHPFTLPLIGRFNVANALATICLGCTRGLPLTQMAVLLKSAPVIPGRLEAVPSRDGPTVLVDHAHTPGALEQVLCCLQEVAGGPVITVFGCGGERDRTKRPLMGEIAARYADRLFVTSDNPRSEDPNAICQAVVAKLPPSSKWEVCVDRVEAIRRAIAEAPPHATILIAGKGHETNQVNQQGTIPFDDRQVARQFLS